MPEPSLAVFVAHSTRIFPDFPHNERSKNERLPLLHFAFFLLHFAFDQQVKRQREVAAWHPHKQPNATPYGRPSITQNSLNEDGAGSRTAVLEHSPAWSSGPKAQPEFAVLALFWFLFWGNAKKGTKTRSNDQKIKTSSNKNQIHPLI